MKRTKLTCLFAVIRPTGILPLKASCTFLVYGKVSTSVKKLINETPGNSASLTDPSCLSIQLRFEYGNEGVKMYVYGYEPDEIQQSYGII